MAITAIQLYDPDFLSQLGSEYICTGFMFDKNIQMESLESKLSKGGFIPGVDIQEAKETFIKMDAATNRVQAINEAIAKAKAAAAAVKAAASAVHDKAFAEAREAYTEAQAKARGRLGVSFKQFAKAAQAKQAKTAAAMKKEVTTRRREAAAIPAGPAKGY